PRRTRRAGPPANHTRRYHELATQREIRANLERITTTGARVAYRSLDVRDAAAVAATIDKVRAEFGPITGVIHGAGVIEDRLILDKTDQQFDRVVGTKVEGLLNLLNSTEAEPL